jgi:tetratricopeptide (TPR) repeat protein
MKRQTGRQHGPASGGDQATPTADKLQQATELYRTGRTADAERVCRAILAAEPGNVRAWVLCAQATAELGDVKGGIELLQTALRLRPDSVAALNGLAALLLRLGRLDAATAACHRALAVEPNNVAANFNLGRIEDAAGRPADSVGAYRRVIELNPALTAARLPLAVALHRLGRLEEAIAAYRSVPAGDPAQSMALFNLGMLHQGRDELAEAASAYAQAIEIKPFDATPRLQLGNVFHAMGRFDDAVDTYRRLLALKPDMAEAHGNMAMALWARGDAEGALAACDEGLRQRPGDTAIIAFKTVLLYEAGDGDGARALVDFDRFLRSTRIAPPAGFDNIADFNAAIARFALQHPTLVQEPRNNATKDGKHTADLLTRPKGPMPGLVQAIESTLLQYLQGLPQDLAHPFAAQRPANWRLSAWAVVMEGQGYQVPHIHPQAWLSGVYYARVPPGIAAADTEHAGWIEFGEPLPEFRCTKRADLRLIRPEEGLMLLFPSYFYHRTLPFHARETRISFAFDVVRAT